MVARAQSKGTIKVGFVTPATGPLAPFGETDGWAIDKVQAIAGQGVWRPRRERYDVEILVRDGQSDPNRAAEVAGDLILNDGVHLIVPASTTDTVSPVADQAELNECPCISTGAPWQAIIFPRGGADKPFKWTYHFFWGLDEALNTFVGLWNTIETNRKVGMLFPQNADGETWGNKEYGLPVPTQEGRLRDRRAGLLPAAHQRLHGADQRLQGSQLRHRRRHHLCRRLQDLREPVRPAGLQAEGHDGRRRAAVPVRRPGARAARRRHVVRSLVDPGLPLQVVADRPGQPRHRRHVGERDRQAVDAAARLQPRHLGSRARHPEARRPIRSTAPPTSRRWWRPTSTR